MKIQSLDADVLIQKNGSADHNENRDAETEQRIPGIRNLPLSVSHRQHIPFLPGAVQHHHTECRHDTKQVIMNHPFILRYRFHSPVPPAASCSLPFLLYLQTSLGIVGKSLIQLRPVLFAFNSDPSSSRLILKTARIYNSVQGEHIWLTVFCFGLLQFSLARSL